MNDFLNKAVRLTGSGQGEITVLLSAMLLTLLLSLLLVFTYDKTTSPVRKSPSFVQALLLMSLVTAIIMQSIGDSLALSFGIFGALAIIRFRSNISDLRDIAFLFATMAVGIACGVHSFANAIMGTVFFCLLVFLLKLSPFDAGYAIRGSIRIEVPASPDIQKNIEACMSPHLSHLTPVRFRVIVLPDATKSNEYEYTFVISDIKAGNQVKDSLEQIPDVQVTRISFDDGTNTGINN